MEENRTRICCRCNIELKSAKINFNYLGHSFQAEMQRCPQCGQVYIPEELVKGRMAEVEMLLEDK